jgi:hypothetical protein
MLLGMQNSTAGDFGIKGVPLIDAPEGGVCKPSGLLGRR